MLRFGSVLLLRRSRAGLAGVGSTGRAGWPATRPTRETVSELRIRGFRPVRACLGAERPPEEYSVGYGTTR